MASSSSLSVTFSALPFCQRADRPEQVAYHVVPYLVDPYGLRKYPGPVLARFSDFYLAHKARYGKRYDEINKLHLKYGPYVRIAPNHLSIADPDALQVRTSLFLSPGTS